MRNRNGLVAVLLALAATPGLASAEPFQWGFRAENADGVLREVTGITASGYADLFLPHPRDHGTFLGDLSPDPTITLNVWRSEADLIITNERDDYSNRILFWWDWAQRWEYTADGELVDVTEKEWSYPFAIPGVLDLGHSRFEILNVGGEMVVSVTATSPEPATLAMAGMGLASVVGLRLRRRLTH